MLNGTTHRVQRHTDDDKPKHELTLHEILQAFSDRIVLYDESLKRRKSVIVKETKGCIFGFVLRNTTVRNIRLTMLLKDKKQCQTEGREKLFQNMK